jgi:hypothetical protein
MRFKILGNKIYLIEIAAEEGYGRDWVSSRVGTIISNADIFIAIQAN